MRTCFKFDHSRHRPEFVSPGRLLACYTARRYKFHFSLVQPSNEDTAAVQIQELLNAVWALLMIELQEFFS
jgi:hypothetical protein